MSKPTLFEQLKTEKIEMVFVEAIPVSQILKPDDGIEPTSELVESVREKGVIEPLVLRSNHGNGRSQAYTIVSGRRRYRAAVLTDTPTVPALLARISPAQESVLTMTLNRLRAQNFLADIRAYEKLLAQKLSEKEIGDLTGLKQQEIDRRKRLVTADSRIRQSIIDGKAKVSVAEAAAKLPPVQQKKLMDQLDKAGGKLTTASIREIKSVQAGRAVAALPQSLFAAPKPPAGLEQFAGRMWELLLEMDSTGMLNVQRPKTGQQVTNARIAANLLIQRIREATEVQPAVNQAEDAERLHKNALALWKREPVAVESEELGNDYAERGANENGVYENYETGAEFRFKKQARLIIRVVQDQKDKMWLSAHDLNTGESGTSCAPNVDGARAFSREEAIECEIIQRLKSLKESVQKPYSPNASETARIKGLIGVIEKRRRSA